MQRLPYRPTSPSETILEGSPSPPSSPPARVTQASAPPIQCPYTASQDDAADSRGVSRPCKYVDSWGQGSSPQRQGSRRHRETHSRISAGDEVVEDPKGCSKNKRSTKTARIPDTMAFHFDWRIGRTGSEVTNVDLKALCASIMLWREKNDIPQSSALQKRTLDGSDEVKRRHGQHTATVSNNPNEIGSVAGNPRRTRPMDWDMLLQQMKRASEDMRRTRKWKMRGLKHAAGWCQWSRKQAARSQGEFVEARDSGNRIHRTIGDETAPKEWTVYLGYRQETATADRE
ncbi:hypothetical protein PV11_00679 [Exophiala sideris]|uniref:Uncharacterized protein n=1 Tax=Exophiala sideris TaxID=1016849 RepID=A0A0D1YTU9_9EURO|nr:hypothetical protein PV11_00679 [Exophiala sideris]